ncbi:MAG: ornithine carbamoyltransferase [Nanoarchaeota archaeon]
MHLLSLNEKKPEQIAAIIEKAKHIKAHPEQYHQALKGKSLLMIFEKPSLRTHISFAVAMTQMGGNAIYYNVQHSPLGKKETIADTAKTASRYVDIIMARLLKYGDILELAKNSSVPVIDGLSDLHHPCQIIADLLTIHEKKGQLKGLKLCYLGDANNNVTHSLMHGTALMGMHMSIGCPQDKAFMPAPQMVQEAQAISKETGGSLSIVHDIKAAVGADIIYTDSWMSYHIPKEEEAARIKQLMPFQVNAGVMHAAKPDAIFMNCLPAMRGYEQSADVIDGPQSIVFDQAENRLHAQKAILLFLLEQFE